MWVHQHTISTYKHCIALNYITLHYVTLHCITLPIYESSNIALLPIEKFGCAWNGCIMIYTIVYPCIPQESQFFRGKLWVYHHVPHEIAILYTPFSGRPKSMNHWLNHWLNPYILWLNSHFWWWPSTKNGEMKPRKPPVGQETSVFTQVMLPDLGGLGRGPVYIQVRIYYIDI